MLRKCWASHCSKLTSISPSVFPWLSRESYKLLFSQPQSVAIRNRVFWGGISESILDTMVESWKKLDKLKLDLVDKSISDLKELVEADIEMENEELLVNSEKLRSLLLSSMDSNDLFEEDKLNARIEVRAGVGGDEALKWAKELFDMYSIAAIKKGYEFESIEQDGNEIFRAIVSCPYSGEARGPYGWFRYESGVHRVQRIPFNSDRIQTSAAAVVVMPKIDLPEIVIKESDLKVSISKKSSGAGGQSVNAAYQQVTMKHVPTGYTVTVADSHAQQENREIAFQRIQKRVQEMEEEKIVSAMTKARKSQIKTADRSEKIRTYNFQRGEINDHRLVGIVVKESCEEFLRNGTNLMETIWEQLALDRENAMVNEFIVNSAKFVDKQYR